LRRGVFFSSIQSPTVAAADWSNGNNAWYSQLAGSFDQAARSGEPSRRVDTIHQIDH
jgi:hypothetical protein